LTKLREHLTRCMDRTIVGKFGIEILNPIGRDSFGSLGEKRTKQTAVSHVDMVERGEGNPLLPF
jgi:hypothetical protein